MIEQSTDGKITISFSSAGREANLKFSLTEEMCITIMSQDNGSDCMFTVTQHEGVRMGMWAELHHAVFSGCENLLKLCLWGVGVGDTPTWTFWTFLGHFLGLH